MSGCPSWCTSPHDEREPRHLAEMRAVTLTPARDERHVPMMFLDLRLAPGDDKPVIHLDRDETPVARLEPSEALDLAWSLILLACMAGEP
jgi:hypothetical protein